MIPTLVTIAGTDVKELRIRIERFCERATREEIQEATRVVSIAFSSPRTVARASFEKDQLNSFFLECTLALRSRSQRPDAPR